MNLPPIVNGFNKLVEDYLRELVPPVHHDEVKESFQDLAVSAFLLVLPSGLTPQQLTDRLLVYRRFLQLMLCQGDIDVERVKLVLRQATVLPKGDLPTPKG